MPIRAGVNAVTRILDELLPAAVAAGASDVHLKVPSPPLLRVDGALVRMQELGEVTPAMAEDCLAAMLARLPHSAKAMEFERRGEVDFAFAHAGVGRFRVNAYRQRGSVTLVLRPVPFAVPRLEELGLPRGLGALVDAPEGLVVVCGPAGSGVTTTVAALVDRMNDGPARTVITIEDPIEVLHADRRCAINQREVGLDTASFAEGLARVLRHDPDVVVIGALADPDTLAIALDAAANGVLVLAAMGAADAPEAMERLVGMNPLHRQPAARAALSACLRAIVSQRLVPREDGSGRRPEVAIYPGEPAPLREGAVSRPAAIAVGSPAATSR